MGRVRVFCSEAFFSSEVRHERSCRGGHQLLPPKVCRSLWILSDAGLHLLQVNHANSVVKFLREAQGNQVMKRSFFLSILKHRLGQIHLQLSFLHVMILIRSRILELTPIAVAGVMLGSFGFICTRLRFDEPMNSNILQGFLLNIAVGLPRICFTMEPAPYGKMHCLMGEDRLGATIRAIAFLAMMSCFIAARF